MADENIAAEERESFVTKIRNAKQNSSGFGECCCLVLCFIFSTACGTILIAILLAFPIAMIVVGTIHLRECPSNPHLPIWLVEWGAMILTRKVMVLINRNEKIRQDDTMRPMDLLVFAWFLAGNVFVFKTPKIPENFEISQAGVKNIQVCHKTLYNWALAFIIIFYITIILAVIGKLWDLFCGTKSKKKQRDQSKVEKQTEIGESV